MDVRRGKEQGPDDGLSPDFHLITHASVQLPMKSPSYEVQFLGFNFINTLLNKRKQTLLRFSRFLPPIRWVPHSTIVFVPHTSVCLFYKNDKI